MQKTDVTFQIGEHFKTFEELECKLKLYENVTSTIFSIKACRTVNAARKQTTRPLSDSIKYYQISYRCIHGGRKLQTYLQTGSLHTTYQHKSSLDPPTQAN